ncbi:MAG: NF038129 family PEP-CTERM protein [Nitrospira sp.]|jgi:hypothetical protein|nr:NF038129 family PEP-CTERM protein [Nitrospira sp.]MBL8053764.1 NF038129 family PEP-CTERM protein [Nitrospira sp.]
MSLRALSIYAVCNFTVRLLIPMIMIVLVPTLALAISYKVDVLTQGLNGTASQLAFDFIAGGSTTNTVTIDSFTTTGGVFTAPLGNTSPSPGTATGTLPAGAVSLSATPSSFFNEYLSNFQLGAKHSFTLNITTAGPSPGFLPDQFSFFILDPGTGLPLFATTDPTGAGSLFTLSMNGTASGALSGYSSTAAIWAVTPVSSVPEPGGLELVMSGAAIIGLLRFREWATRQPPHIER